MLSAFFTHAFWMFSLAELISQFSYEKSDALLNQLEETILYHAQSDVIIPSLLEINQVVLTNIPLYPRYISLLSKILSKYPTNVDFYLTTFYTLIGISPLNVEAVDFHIDQMDNIPLAKAIIAFVSTTLKIVFDAFVRREISENEWKSFYNFGNSLCNSIELVKNDGVKNLLIKLHYEFIIVLFGQENFAFNEDLLDRWQELRNASYLSAGSLIAMLNLSISLIKQQPNLTSFILPLLLDLHENPPKQFTPNQLKSVQHSLRLQLVNISKQADIPAQVIPFIDEALIELGVGKSATLSKGLSRRKQAALAQAAREKQRKIRQSREQEEQEEEQSKQEIEEDILIDPTCIPLPWIIELITSSLATTSVGLLQSMIAEWKPPAAQAGPVKRITRDPRLAGQQPPELKQMEIDFQPQIKPTPLVDSNQNMVKFIFERILSAEQTVNQFNVRDKWASLLTKLAIFLSNDVSDGTGKGVKETFISFVFGNFRERADLAIFWLHKEWINDYLNTSTDSNYQTKYPALFLDFLQRLQDSVDVRDKTLGKFLTEAPSLLDCQRVVELLRSYCNDPVKMPLGLYTLKDLIIKRPSVRAIFLPILIEYCFSSVAELRKATLLLIGQYLRDDSGIIAASVRKLSAYVNACQDMQSDSDEGGQEDKLEFIGIISSSQIDSYFHENCDLFFELLQTNISLWDTLIKLYPTTSHTCRLLIRNATSNVISGESEFWFSTIRNYSLDCQLLINRVLLAFKTSPSVFQIVCEIYKEGKANEYIFLPFLGPLLKNEFESTYLPILTVIIGNCVQEVDQRIAQESVSRLVRPESDICTPAEFALILLRNESKLGLKRTVDCIQVCLSLNAQFNQSVWTQVLQSAFEFTPLPMSFMRTLIQAVTLHKGVGVGGGGTLQQTCISILSKLVLRKVWQQPTQWEGFIRSVRILLPHSLPIVIQLPIDPFRELVDKIDSLVIPLKQYINQQPPSLQHRLAQQSSILERAAIRIEKS